MRNRQIVPAGQGSDLGTLYPIQSGTSREVTPTSAPNSFSFEIENTNSSPTLVPLFGIFHLNDEANALIVKAQTTTGGDTTPAKTPTITEAIRNFDPEAPVQGVVVKATSGKPLASFNKLIQTMPIVVTGINLTSQNANQFDESLRLQYDDWDGSKNSETIDLDDFKNEFAQDGSRLKTNISFLLDGRLTMFLRVPAQSTVKMKLATEFHLNRF